VVHPADSKKTVKESAALRAPAPSVVFCSEEHQVEWFRSRAAEPNDTDDQ
jgi:hypothetical protein